MTGPLSSGSLLPVACSARQPLTTGGTQEQRARPGPASRGEPALSARERVSSPPQTGPLPASTTLGGQDARAPACSPPAARRTSPAASGLGEHRWAQLQLSPSRCRQRPALSLGAPSQLATEVTGPACQLPGEGSCWDPQPQDHLPARGGVSSPGVPLVQRHGTGPVWGPWPPLSHPTEMGLHLQWPEASCWHKGAQRGHGGG